MTDFFKLRESAVKTVEPINEEVNTDRLKQLARLGLVDKVDVNRLMQAMKKIDDDKPLSVAERGVVLGIVGDLVDIITGDPTVFQKAKKAISEAAEDEEPASPDEAGMAMTQLEFIEYAAEEIMDHIRSGKRFPEWMQNKLTKVHSGMEGLHSSIGDHGQEEEMEEDLSLNFSRTKTPYRKLTKALNKNKTKKDLEDMRKRLDKLNQGNK